MKNMKKEIWKMSNIKNKDKNYLFILLIFMSEINNLIKLNYIVK